MLQSPSHSITFQVHHDMWEWLARLTKAFSCRAGCPTTSGPCTNYARGGR